MATSEVQELVDAVRRRLWREQFIAALRLALWGSAGLMLLALALHLAVRRVPIGGMLPAIAGLWLWLLVRAGWRRPSDSACALWTDRHLDGACAFSTLLEIRNGKHGPDNAPAVQWIEQWASARAPAGLRLLAARHEPSRLLRPLLSTLVCAALSALVMALPEPAPDSRPPSGAPSPPGRGDVAAPTVQAPAAAKLVDEVATALRSAEPRATPTTRSAGRTPATAPGKTSDGQAMPEAEPRATPADATPTDRASPGTSSFDGVPASATARTSGSGAGRAAGDRRDDGADAGVSRAPRGTIAARRSESQPRRASTEQQAAAGQLARYDEEPSRQAAAAKQTGKDVAAATPPSATESTRLTLSETSYVQAWMRASVTPR